MPMTTLIRITYVMPRRRHPAAPPRPDSVQRQTLPLVGLMRSLVGSAVAAAINPTILVYTLSQYWA